MQKHHRRGQHRRQVGEVDDFIEAVQLGCEMKTEGHERDEAQNVEMPGFVGGAAAEVNK